MQRVLMGLGLLIAAGTAVSSAIDQSCDQAGGVDTTVFQELKSRPLTETERESLTAFIDHLDGQWRGAMVEEICNDRKPPLRHTSRSTLQVRETRDGMALRSKDVRVDNGVVRLMEHRLHVTKNGLRVDSLGKRGDVEIVALRGNELAFKLRLRGSRLEERFRMLFRRNKLLIEQRFLSNGVYAGGKTWQLER